MIPVLKIAAIVGGIGFIGTVASVIAALNAKSQVKAKWCFRATLLFMLAMVASILTAIFYCSTVFV